MLIFKRFSLATLVLAFPIVAFSAPRDFGDVVAMVTDFISLLVPLLIGIAFVFVIWGIAKAWVIDAGNEESTQTGKMILITGVIGLLVMVGLWGIVSLVRSAIFFG